MNKKIKRFLRTASTIAAHAGLPCGKYGFFVPYPLAGKAASPAGLYPLKNIQKILDSNLPAFKKLAKKTAGYNDIFANFAKGEKKDSAAPRFNQDWFCGIDGAFAYALTRMIKPETIIDVGAGFNTRFLARAVKDEGLKTKIYSINPKKLHGAQHAATQFFETTLDKVPAALLKNLKANDILFIDASHLFMPGTDLELLFLEVLPALPSGVYIHLHDIFLPDAYPDNADWNYWAFNEQAALALLLQGGAYEIVLPCAWLRRHRPEIIKDINAPLHPRGLESSFWIKKI